MNKDELELFGYFLFLGFLVCVFSFSIAGFLYGLIWWIQDKYKEWQKPRIIAAEDITTEFPIYSLPPSRIRLFFEKLGYPKRRWMKNWKDYSKECKIRFD